MPPLPPSGGNDTSISHGSNGNGSSEQQGSGSFDDKNKFDVAHTIALTSGQRKRYFTFSCGTHLPILFNFPLFLDVSCRLNLTDLTIVKYFSLNHSVLLHFLNFCAYQSHHIFILFFNLI